MSVIASGLMPRSNRSYDVNFKLKVLKAIEKKPLTREEELLLENESLHAKNALLKKLQALIQAEESKKRKP